MRDSSLPCRSGIVALRVSHATVLRSALAYHDERFERSIGRSVRRHGGDYEDYLAIVSRLRGVAETRGGTLREAASWLLDHS